MHWLTRLGALAAVLVVVLLVPVPYSGDAQPPDPLPVSSCWTEEWEGTGPLSLVLVANLRDEEPALNYSGTRKQHCT
jgi:hypothetical protein